MEMFQEISPILLNIFRGVRRLMKKRNNFLIKKYELFLVWTLLPHHACSQTQMIDGRRQTEGGRRYMTGSDPEIQSCHAITWMSHKSFFHGAMRYVNRTCIFKSGRPIWWTVFAHWSIYRVGKIVLNMHQIYFRPFWLTLRDALALIKYVLGVG